MIKKIGAGLLVIPVFAAIIYTNWFWRLIIGPMAFIFAFDIFNNWRDRKRETNPSTK